MTKPAAYPDSAFNRARAEWNDRIGGTIRLDHDLAAARNEVTRHTVNSQQEIYRRTVIQDSMPGCTK